GGRGTAAGEVTLDCAAPAGGLTVALASSHPSVKLPANLTVPAGATTAAFSLTTEPVSARTSVVVSAARAGLSQTVTLTVLPDPPSGAPTALVATIVTPNQIRLIWTDNSGNETGFEIERKSGSAAFARIATVGANTGTFTDGSLAPNTTYTYRV